MIKDSSSDTPPTHLSHTRRSVMVDGQRVGWMEGEMWSARAVYG